MGRIAFIDHVRNFANFLRIFIHAGIPYMVTFPPSWPVDEPGHMGFDFMLFEGHLFVMELFFLVAGFMFALQFPKTNLHHFVKNRFRRIVVPFLLGMIIFVPFVLMMFSIAEYKSYEWISLPVITQAYKEGLLLGWDHFFPTAHLWFLYYLILFYGVAIVLYRFGFEQFSLKISMSFYLPFACCISFLSMFLLQRWMIDNPLSLVPEFTSFVHFFLFFLGGILLFKRRDMADKLLGKGGQLLVLGLIAGILSAGCQLYYENPQHNYYTLIGIAARATYALGSYLLAYGTWLYIKQKLTTSSAVSQYLANASYWIYLVSMPVILFLHVLFLPLQISIFVKYLAVVVLGVLVSVLSYELKLKVSRSIRKIL